MQEAKTEQERAASEKSRLIQEMSDDMLSGPFGSVQGTFELCTDVGLNGSASRPANSPLAFSVGQAPAAVQKPLLASG